MQFLIDFLCKDGNSECRVWMLATVFITAVVVYLNSLTMGFVWDDINLILQPGPLRSLENIPYFFKNSVAAGLKFGNHTPYYRPVFSLSLALDYFFWGIAPFGYHLTNILMHAAVSCLVFLISARIFSSTPAALAAALVYALHPVHAEAVAYVGARNELLCGLFVAASFLLYLKYRTGLNLYNLLLVQILFFAALLSKEMAATLPLIVVFYEISIGDSSFKKAVIRSIPFFALLGLYLLLRSAILDVTTWESPPLPVRSYTGVGIVASYLELLIFPFKLKTFYDIEIKWQLMQADVLIPLVILFIPILFGILLFKRDKIIFFSLSWIYIGMIPASGAPALIMPAFMAERYLYIPSIGFALLFGRIIKIALRWQPGEPASEQGKTLSCAKHFKTVIIFSSVLFITYFYTTFTHNYSWKDEPTFYKKMISDAPKHQLGYDLLGSYYGRRNENLEMAKNYMTSMTLAWNEQIKLGDSYAAYGYYDKAEDTFMQMVKHGYGDVLVKARLEAIKEAKKRHKIGVQGN